MRTDSVVPEENQQKRHATETIQTSDVMARKTRLWVRDEVHFHRFRRRTLLTDWHWLEELADYS
jgi:hypothetical protein